MSPERITIFCKNICADVEDVAGVRQTLQLQLTVTPREAAEHEHASVCEM